jgi:endo-1,4-beta-xylanase
MFGKVLGVCSGLGVLLLLAACYPGTDLVTNGGFENGTDGWSGRSCEISAAASPVHSGSGSAKVSGRTEDWQGIKQSMLGKMQNGQTYQISGWVRLANAESGTVIVSIERTDDRGTDYINVGKTAAGSNDWTQVSGEFKCDLKGAPTTLDVYFEGPAAGVDFFVDDVNVCAPSVSAPTEPNEPNKPKEPNQPM